MRRTILVDDVEGTGHELYGTLPNMTYVIDRGGKVLFRSDWTDPPTIERVLGYILDARKQRREGLRMAPFYSEMVGYRWSDLSKHHEVLERAGPPSAVRLGEQPETRRSTTTTAREDTNLA